MNCKQMLKDLHKLPHSPNWHNHKVKIQVGSEMHTEYFLGCNIIQVVRELIRDPQHKDDMCYAPQQHWTSEKQDIHIYSEMWMGCWWWRQQVSMLDSMHAYS
jgi:hypothetical protein